MSELIMVCTHVYVGREPEVVWMEQGNVEAATCRSCADQIKNGSETASETASDPLTMLCHEHARAILRLATQFTCDGFWIHHPQKGWSHQPDEKTV